MTVNLSKTTPDSDRHSINVHARANNVICKLSLKVSTIEAAAGKINKDTMNLTPNVELVSIGPDVKDLKLGDKVILTGQPSTVIELEDNQNTLAKLEKHYSLLHRSVLEEIHRDKERNKVDLITYAIYPEYQVVAVIN